MGERKFKIGERVRPTVGKLKGWHGAVLNYILPTRRYLVQVMFNYKAHFRMYRAGELEKDN